jgi:hypothetical protein
MKVNYNYIILILILGLSIYVLNVNKMMEHFKCTKDQVNKAYNSYMFKPRRPEHMDCVAKPEKDDQGQIQYTCNNKKYDDNQIKANFKVDGVPEDCILELVKTWNW